MVEIDEGPTAQDELALLSGQKAQADAVREEFDLMGQSLLDRGVTQWGRSDYEDALAVAEAAAKAYEVTQFLTAEETWDAGLERLRSLDARAAELLIESLARGQGAIERGQRELAEKEFSMALLVDPGNQAATAGMARAEHIEEALALMARAESLEQQGLLHEARDIYRKVAGLDGEIKQVPEGISRMDAAIVERSYAKAMSQGYAALGVEDFEAARKAFRTAARIHPNASEPREGLKQVAGGQRVTGIEGHRDRAANFEASERWQDAVTEYDAALAIDAGLVFAQEGRLRAAARADLDERLQGFIDAPDRLYTVNVLQSAGEAVQQASRVPHPGPRLVGQATRLAGLMEQATQTVPVTLRSDNLTDVMVFRVGRLGLFEQFELQLKPGTYTVQGTRKGYRDVQRKLTVRPGQKIDPVMIRCEEPI
jgi:tetratricopeptide (TPR) repeat protein